jgi:hypothetical protein
MRSSAGPARSVLPAIAAGRVGRPAAAACSYPVDHRGHGQPGGVHAEVREVTRIQLIGLAQRVVDSVE